MKQLFKLLNFSLILIFIVAIFLHRDSSITQDLGRHLTLGKIIWETKSIPSRNIFSYTNTDFPFINHHWGSEVIIYLLHNRFAIDGLILLKLILILISFGILVFYSQKTSQPVILLLVSLISLQIVRDRTEIRPEIFAYLFFSLILILLYREKEKEQSLIWLMPLFILIWVNLHISFVLGLALYALFIFDRIVLGKLKAKYLLLGIIILLTTLINPAGWKGAIYPLQIFNSYGYPVFENQSPFFLEKLTSISAISYYKIASIFFLLISPILIWKRKIFEAGTVILTGVISISAVRHFPFFALSIIYPLSFGMGLLLTRCEKLLKHKEKFFFIVKISTYIIILSLISWEIYMLVSNKYYNYRSSDLRTGFGTVKGIKGAVDFFLTHNLSGPIFNNFDIGSYLIYRLYPKQLVFVDGRPEAYPASFFQDIYIPMQEEKNKWESIVNQYNFQTIIFSHTDITPWAQKFLERIVKDPVWGTVYFDDYSIVLTRIHNITKDMIRIDSKEKIKNYGLTIIQETNQPDALFRLSHFFDIVNLTELRDLALLKTKEFIY